MLVEKKAAKFNLMRIGIFDSGLGGLIITRAIRRKLPKHDLIYLGDVARVPYGNRSPKAVYEFTREAVDYLFKHGAVVIILACNTASALALRKLQQEYLPKHYPNRRILGVIRPTAELAAKLGGKTGVIGTVGTIQGKTFNKEIKKLSPRIQVVGEAAPLLVPLAEHNGLKWSEKILETYLAPLKKQNIENLILGCTHYPLFKSKIRHLVGGRIKVLSQDEIIPKSLSIYFNRHPEIDKRISKSGHCDLLVTDRTNQTEQLARKWFGSYQKLKVVSLPKID